MNHPDQRHETDPAQTLHADFLGLALGTHTTARPEDIRYQGKPIVASDGQQIGSEALVKLGREYLQVEAIEHATGYMVIVREREPEGRGPVQDVGIGPEGLRWVEPFDNHRTNGRQYLNGHQGTPAYVDETRYLEQITSELGVIAS